MELIAKQGSEFALLFLRVNRSFFLEKDRSRDLLLEKSESLTVKNSQNHDAKYKAF